MQLNENKETATTKSTKDRILDVAINMFSKEGYNGVSIRDITKEVGIKESSLYNHFRNKEEILETIMTLFRKEFAKTLPPIEMLDAILASSTIEQFFGKGFESIKDHIDNPLNEKLWRILYIEHYRDAYARDIFLNDIIHATLQFLDIVFEKFMKLGKVKSMSPRLLSAEYQYPMFSMLAEYNMLRFDDKDTSDIETRMKEHIQFFIETVKL